MDPRCRVRLPPDPDFVAPILGRLTPASSGTFWPLFMGDATRPPSRLNRGRSPWQKMGAQPTRGDLLTAPRKLRRRPCSGREVPWATVNRQKRRYAKGLVARSSRAVTDVSPGRPTGPSARNIASRLLTGNLGTRPGANVGEPLLKVTRPRDS